jgi:heat shock protein HslJ
MKKFAFITILLSTFLSVHTQAMHRQKKKSTKQTEQEKLVGTWELNYIERVELADLYKDKMPTINFDAKTSLISGYNGCNSFSGMVKIEGNQISFPKPMEQTLVACEGDGEQKFIEAMGTVQTFAFSEANKLDLIAGDRAVMQFTRVVKLKK